MFPREPNTPVQLDALLGRVHRDVGTAGLGDRDRDRRVRGAVGQARGRVA